MSRALRGETVHDVEMVLEAKSGRRRSMIADAKPLCDSSGKLVGALVVWHDVTEQRRAWPEMTELARPRPERRYLFTVASVVSIRPDRWAPL